MSLKAWLHRRLRQPELAEFDGRNQDSLEYTQFQRRIISRKPFLKFIYDQYSQPFLRSARRAPKDARMLEIGAGISPLKSHIPSLICSDVVRFDWLDLACSAYELPFADQSLDRVFAMFVLHHLGRLETFLDEVRRCLKPGGELVIQDPAMTLFSRQYFKLHVDACVPDATDWRFDGDGRLSDSNVALAWMAFIRDRDRFEHLYPELEIVSIEYDTIFSFLLCGGLSFRQLLPDRMLRALFAFESWIISNVSSALAVHMTVTIRRKP